MLSQVTDLLAKYPAVIFLFIYFVLLRPLRNRLVARGMGQPVSVGPSHVKVVKNIEDWKRELMTAEKEGQLLVVDCYATWCPPCKKAAPVFAEMSNEFTDTVFVKVDVNEASDVSELLGVKAMPTFYLFKAGKEVQRLQGWDQGKVVAMLKAHGSKPATKKNK